MTNPKLNKKKYKLHNIQITKILFTLKNISILTRLPSHMIPVVTYKTQERSRMLLGSPAWSISNFLQVIVAQGNNITSDLIA